MRASTPPWRTSSSTSCSSRTSPRTATAALPPPWILEGTAAALETRVCAGARRPRVDAPAAPLVRGDGAEHRLAELRRPAALAQPRRASSPGSCPRSSVASPPSPPPVTEATSSPPRTRESRGAPFAQAFHRFAVAVAGDHGDVIEPAFRLGPVATAQRRRRAARRALRQAGAAARRRLRAHRHLPARRAARRRPR